MALVLSWVRPAVVVGLATFAWLSTLCLWVAAPDDSALTVLNQAPLAARSLGLLIGAVGAALTVGGLYFWKGASGRAERFEVGAATTAPFVLTPLVPVLYDRAAWEGRELAYLCYLLLFALALEALCRRCIDVLHSRTKVRALFARVLSILRSRRVAWVPSLVILAGIAWYVYRVGTLTNVTHIKMGTMSSDLAEFDNLFYNALHGHPFRAPAIEGELQNWSALKVHAEFGLWLLLPFYALAPGAEALLWIQTVIVALTAVPLFLLGRAALGPWAGGVFGCAYLLMPAVQRPNFYDFHFTPLGMFFVAWLLFFTFCVARDPANHRMRLAMYAAFALALTSREDVSIGLFVLGVFLILRKTLVSTGVLFAAVSLAYFVVVKFAVMPLFGTMWFDAIYQDLKAEGLVGFRAVIATLLTNPAHAVRSLLTEPKFLYSLHMAVPVAALWVRRPIFWLAVLPGFVSTLLVTNRPPMFQTSFQYTYLWVPYVVAASVIALRDQRIRVASLVALLVVSTSLDRQLGVVFGGQRIWGGFYLRTFEVSEQERERLEQLRELIAMIPPSASVAATEAEGPHVSTRLVMYSLKFTLGENPDYLLVGQTHRPGEVIHVKQALASGNYGVIATKGPFILAKKGADTKDNRELWRRVGGRAPRRR